jgi:hypothetical protein
MKDNSIPRSCALHPYLAALRKREAEIYPEGRERCGALGKPRTARARLRQVYRRSTVNADSLRHLWALRQAVTA